MTRLDEFGIESKIKWYALVVQRYKKLNKLSKKLAKRFPSTFRKIKPTRTRAQLYFMAEQGGEKEKITQSTVNSALPLTFEMLQVMFVICLCLLIIAKVSFLCEKLKYMVLPHFTYL